MTKTLFITGASSGIGAATAQAAAKAGWNVGLFARSEDKLKNLARDIGDQALVLTGDATSYDDQEQAMRSSVRLTRCSQMRDAAPHPAGPKRATPMIGRRWSI